MIGVFCDKNEELIVREFFELFKTPWEFWDSHHDYDVVISTLSQIPECDAKLVVFYSSRYTEFDIQWKIAVKQGLSDDFVVTGDIHLPIYGAVAKFDDAGSSLLRDQSDTGNVAIELFDSSKKFIRVGYDLFYEIAYLINGGQPVENAMMPSLDIHISLLRDWIAAMGTPFVEIPPLPHGYKFMVCLTHDIDFAGIRWHKFDQTMWGFVYRGLVGSLFNCFSGRISVEELARNWGAVVKLPLVFVGLSDDYWEHFDKYAEIDKGLGSTFFLIPFKNRPGDDFEDVNINRRAVSYDLKDVREQISHLTTLGFEIALHGIDAWGSVEKGLQEMQRIVELTGRKEIGIRMHWLFYDHNSPATLEKAGFDYDATLGYNETIGFKNGTLQVFQPFGMAKLLEIPLNIQDTALFYPRRLNLNRKDALCLCNQLVNFADRYGGVLTVSWHDRSLEPERLWGRFYVKLLKELQSRGAWIGCAHQIVSWFRCRRSIAFEESRFTGDRFAIKLNDANLPTESKIFLRVYNIHKRKNKLDSGSSNLYIDIPLTGNGALEIDVKKYGV